MLAKTILAEATHGQGSIAEAVAAERNHIETSLAESIADSGKPLSFQLKRLKMLAAGLVGMPIRSRELTRAFHKTRLQEQDTVFKRSNVSNGRPYEKMSEGIGCSPSGKSASREEA